MWGPSPDFLETPICMNIGTLVGEAQWGIWNLFYITSPISSLWPRDFETAEYDLPQMNRKLIEARIWRIVALYGTPVHFHLNLEEYRSFQYLGAPNRD